MAIIDGLAHGVHRAPFPSPASLFAAARCSYYGRTCWDDDCLFIYAVFYIDDIMAALLKSFDDGINNNADPGEAEERNIYEAMEAGKQVKKLPMSLGEALDALDADEVVRSAMPDEMYKVVMHYKRDEWERFNPTVTEWDVNTYLDYLP